MPKRSQKIIHREDSEGNTITYFGYGEVPERYSMSGISQCCKGKLNKYKGFVWSYAEATMLRTCSLCEDIIHNGNMVNLKKAEDGKFFRCKPCNRDVGNEWHKHNYKESYANKRLDINKRRQEDYQELKKNKDKYEEFLESSRKVADRYRSTSKGKAIRAANEAARRASKLSSTPDWLTDFDYDYIKSLYIQAQELNKLSEENYHVDHIIPLRGKDVKGLHVPWNLQILEAVENIKKSNKVIKE